MRDANIRFRSDIGRNGRRKENIRASKAIATRERKAPKRDNKLYWYVQWREEGKPRCKELGLCKSMPRFQAEAMLQDILRPINEGIAYRER